MLSYRRPANSETEEEFIAKYIAPTGASPDAFGNYILRIGETPILWSCHTDTVHRMTGRQRIEYIDGVASVPIESSSNCLGADDTAGVWMMLEMIEDKVPGLYIFHRSEEIGGLGSHYISKNTQDILAGIKVAIAFDRRKFSSIITHQGFTRCCSNAFANSLKPFLPDFEPDDTGIFTDTSNYTDIIPECSNISVGYEHEHSRNETLDVLWLIYLSAYVKRIDFASLAIERDPSVVDYGDAWSSFYSLRNYDLNVTKDPKLSRMHRLVYENPEEVAQFLLDSGFSVEEMQETIDATRYILR